MAMNVRTAIPGELSKLDHYRQVVMQFLQRQCGESNSEGIESQQVFDQKHDCYLVLTQGWRGQERVYWVSMHVELRDSKVWIQRNQTEVEIEAELVALGIPQENIVLGLIPPAYRLLAGLPAT